jgi:hypothetical protein
MMSSLSVVEASTFVFVKIPESIMPVPVATSYEDPLDDALKQAGLEKSLEVVASSAIPTPTAPPT